MLDRVTIERTIAAAGEDILVVALSGGGDSVALLHLLAETLPKRRLRAVVVDHALREGSAADAARAAGIAAALDVAVSVKRLEWLAASTRGQESARAARYRALCEIARDCGARVLVLGHTADDQAETVLMRAAAGSTWRGLAAMAPLAPAPVWPEGRGVLVARPLLRARRAGLRALLRARGVQWLEDPANVNPAFSRVRARECLARLARAGLEIGRLVSLADRLQARLARLDADAAALAAKAARFDQGRILITLEQWSGGLEARRRALSVLIAAAAGAEREPDGKSVERLEARLKESGFRGATLGGAALRAADGLLVLERDPGGLLGRSGGGVPLPPLQLPAARRIVWDGRLELVASEPGWRVEVSRNGPILKRNGAPLPVSEAGDAVQARWLARERVEHLLARALPP